MNGYVGAYEKSFNESKYKIGNVYNFKDEPKDNIFYMGGYCFFNGMKDIIQCEFNIKTNFILLEINAIGKVYSGKFNLTDRIKIVRIVPKEEWNELFSDIKFDEKLNVIYEKNEDNYEIWFKYDERNNLIYSKDSIGFEQWREYDEKNRLSYFKDSTGLEYWNYYDENGNIIDIKRPNCFN